MADDELTHRLWWKLGDYLRGAADQTEFFLWLCSLDGTRYRRIMECFGDGPTNQLPLEAWRVQRRQRFESLYSELTWELMGPVAWT